jgi:hypothetical protein
MPDLSIEDRTNRQSRRGALPAAVASQSVFGPCAESARRPIIGHASVDITPLDDKVDIMYNSIDLASGVELLKAALQVSARWQQ